MSDFLWFRWMLTPHLLIVAWWVMAAGSVLGGLVLLFGVTGSAAAGLGLLIGGPLVSRLVCELLIVTFAIHANLSDIRAAMLRQEDAGE